jgi:hypothetical protein
MVGNWSRLAVGPTVIAMRHRPSIAPHRVRSDLGPAGTLVAAAIVALFFVDAVRAAPVRLAVKETPAHEVTLTVEADAAPTFQVYRGNATADGQQWVVELPGAAITDGVLALDGTMLLVDAVSEAPRRGPARVVLTFADDVDFDAATKKGTLAVRFHHVGDEATLKAAHSARLARLTQADERRRQEDAERERRAKLEAEKAAAAERERLAKLEAERRAKLEAEKAAAAERERLAKLEAERLAKLEAERLAKLEAEKAAAAERARLAKLEAEKAAAAERARLAKLEAERVAAARGSRPADDDVGFGGRPMTAAPPITRSTSTAGAEGFGGGRAVEFSRAARYERVALPRDGDVYGFEGDGDEDDIDEREGRSVLSQVTVQRTSSGARLGVLVDGGARYHVGRRGRDRLVLTLLDTRARTLDVRRTLDARAVGGPIVRVAPSVDEDRRFRIELAIDTRGPAPVRIQQDGQILWLEVGE